MIFQRWELRHCGRAQSYRFGGDSSSASTSQTTQIDKRQVVDTGSTGVTADNSNINVNVTSSQKEALASANTAIKQAADSINLATRSGFDLTKSTTQLAFKTLAGALNTTANLSASALNVAAGRPAVQPAPAPAKDNTGILIAAAIAFMAFKKG